ncbi:RNA-binding protein [Sansalvadorimonas sp. 2012CJ34-2]|uniref:RNA-binding protein n=1 Tax=Parendozoicomonas callyspongiae TaxID=2942213 RepID=A0ABT0PFL5_9GAMM|nr:RNA-binding protein [Sansalvadorimonas sp. 2012CJ34-2]MCL6270170.1 RNA-binding protein [Sansalvadorimonas sp. 2012CJ34-2]
MDNREIYIGNLSWSATEDDLSAAFEGYGNVDHIKLIRDRESGKSRGFAFIRYAEKNGAEAALEMDGQKLLNRNLRVRLATPKPQQNHQRRQYA